MSLEENPLALVIEDDPEQQNIFTKAIEMAGFSVEAIGNGKQAIARLDEVSPKLIVLDLHLPGVSGDEILHHIRADERLASARVMLATADPLRADTLRDQSDLVLLKPVSFIQLRDLAIRLRSGIQ
ncbi:MAG: response regulator [Anaerolineae bacterium]|jgi:CheY-like chemotaxis protein|nr:response regulator [Anaerolineae bacterium]MBT3714563.1 response regulator [Anaerolineae bacterium]MBT4311853.1 response regulator [Anaerolineae bacterium]MBT4458079.1 response regulator [Anaerolineae bacterium]MBT4842521.1 response regulator [Anaerolineae bacterium]